MRFGQVNNRVAAVAVMAGAVHVLGGAAMAQQTLLKVDNLPVAGPCDPLVNPACNTRVQLGFEGTEIGAVTYFLDPALFPLRVIKVQILWGYDNLSCPTPPANNLQDGIIIYSGAFGSLRTEFQSDPIQLTPGFLNEFDFTTANIVIQNGGISNALTVGMRFDASGAPSANGIPNLCAASLMTDGDGCQSLISSLVKSVGGAGTGWITPCALGMSGDFVIRTLVEPVNPICKADCDQSTGAGVLDIFDFLCFQNGFVTGDPKSCDCDTSTGAGVCDVFDFLCFQALFVAGCP
jgi:hypothetical protein